MIHQVPCSLHDAGIIDFYLNLTCFRIMPNKIYFIFRLFFFFAYRTLFVIRKVIERLPYIIQSNLYRYKVYNSFDNMSFWFIWTLLGQFWVKWWEIYIFKNMNIVYHMEHHYLPWRHSFRHWLVKLLIFYHFRISKPSIFIQCSRKIPKNHNSLEP